MIKQYITSGDTIKLQIALKKNDEPFVISTNAVVKAAITNKEFSALLSPVILINEVVGSDWSNSVIVFTLDALNSSMLPEGNVGIEIKVIDNNTCQTWQIRGLKINRSLIS